VSVKKPLLLLFWAWLLTDVAFLAVGMCWHWLLGVGRFGLVLDFLLGIFVLGEYLHENGKL
jgi:hypothetical protein